MNQEKFARGLLQFKPSPEVNEAKRIVEHSNQLGRQAIYDPLCQAEHGAFYIMYGQTPEEVLDHVPD